MTQKQQRGLLGVAASGLEDILLEHVGPPTIESDDLFVTKAKEMLKLINKNETLQLAPHLNPDFVGRGDRRPAPRARGPCSETRCG